MTIYYPYMKKITEKLKSIFSGNTMAVNDAPKDELTQEEMNKRIDMAAKHTVERYGHIIERLAKE